MTDCAQQRKVRLHIFGNGVHTQLRTRLEDCDFSARIQLRLTDSCRRVSKSIKRVNSDILLAIYLTRLTGPRPTSGAGDDLRNGLWKRSLAFGINVDVAFTCMAVFSVYVTKQNVSMNHVTTVLVYMAMYMRKRNHDEECQVLAFLTRLIPTFCDVVSSMLLLLLLLYECLARVQVNFNWR